MRAGVWCIGRVKCHGFFKGVGGGEKGKQAINVELSFFLGIAITSGLISARAKYGVGKVESSKKIRLANVAIGTQVPNISTRDGRCLWGTLK